MTPGSVMRAITCNGPPQWGHRLKSTTNTRFSRTIQPSGGLRTLGWGSGSSVPEPGAGTLVGLGLLAMGAGGIRRLRQRREAQPAH